MSTKTNFMDAFVESQKQMIDTMTTATKKLVNDKAYAETMDKSNDFYKNWLDNQNKFISEQTARMQEIAGGKMDANDVTENVKSWMENQMQLTNQYINFSKGMLANYMENMKSVMPTLNGSGEKIKNMFEQNFDTLNTWNQMMEKNYQMMMSNFTNGKMKDTFEGMFNNVNMFGKFAEMWKPMFDSMQNNTFKAEDWTKMMNPASFQEFVNTMFGYMSDYMNNFTKMYNAGMQNPFASWMNNNPMMSQFQQMFTNGMSNIPFAAQWNDMSNNMQKMFGQFNPAAMNMMNAQPHFATWMNNYNNMYSQMQQAMHPMMTMMTPGDTKQTMDAAMELSHLYNQYQIKMNEMMYMNYTTGTKAMQKIAEMMQARMNEGKPFKNLMSLYSEFLNTSDKVFVELFESNEYSKVQAEVAALSHQLKKQTELMTEKMINHLPIITRTEMDELYKAFYDLRKEVYNQGKAAKTETKAETKAQPKAAAPKATAPKAATKPTGKKK